MTQKVQFIATLIAKPQLVLLDEPFSGLDPVNAVVLRDTILDLRRTGTTVIFSTHDMPVAERMCDVIFMIYKGQQGARWHAGVDPAELRLATSSTYNWRAATDTMFHWTTCRAW